MKPRLGLAALLMLTVAGCAARPAGPPRDYYISPSGDDRAGDGGVDRPFATLQAVNNLALNPGDRVLLQGGATFTGGILLDEQDGGAPDQPVVIGSYGQGRATIDAGEGSAILVRGVSGLVIRDLRLISSAPGLNQGCGVEAERLSGRRRARGLWLDNLESRGFGREGISVCGRGAAGFETVRISNCIAVENRHGGIFVQGDGSEDGFSHRDIAIQRCIASDNPGDPAARMMNRSGSGIYLSGVDNGLVDQCLASGNGAQSRGRRGGAMGIWASHASGIVIQRCRSVKNRTAGDYDGGGFGLDGGVSKSVLRYNHSAENDGSGYGIFQFQGASPNQDNLVHHNVSLNDGRRNGYAAVHVWNGGNGIRRLGVLNNTLVIGQEAQSANAAVWLQSATVDARFQNNLVIAAGRGLLMDVAPGQAGLSMSGNAYVPLGVSPAVYFEGRSFNTLRELQLGTGQEARGTLWLTQTPLSSLDPPMLRTGSGLTLQGHWAGVP